MLTVVMECRDQEAELAQTLAALVSGAVEGLVSEVIVLDHGSADGSARVADAAGCRFLGHWDLADILRSARGGWLLLLQPGARPQGGWIDALHEHILSDGGPARFSEVPAGRQPFYRRIFTRASPLANGLLLARDEALALARSGMGLEALAGHVRAKRLASQVMPAPAARRAR